jgi:hypothetical protein
MVTAPQAPTTPYPRRAGFDQPMAGQRAECDGGTPAPTGGGTREEFTGTLTGEYVDHGDPPWRWYRMTNLSRKPEGYDFDEVWCEKDSLFFLDERR